MRLLKRSGALTVETMCATTVMDKSINLSADVKYPTAKDRPRGAWLEPRGLTENMGEHGCLCVVKRRGSSVGVIPTR